MIINKSYLLMAFSLTATVFLGRFVSYLLNKYIKRSTHINTRNIGQYLFLKHLAVALVYLVGLGISIYMLPQFQNLSLSILASSSVLAVIFGFASQHALGNIMSGIFITIFRPYVIGDRIGIPGKNVLGVVEDMTLRHTVIRTFENKRVVIPNAVMSVEIIENADLNDEKVCRYVEFGISYESDLEKALKIMEEEVLAHPDLIDNRTPEEIHNKEPKVPVRVVTIGESSINLRAWAWFSDWTKGYIAGCDLNKSIKLRFDREGIEIPYPHRTIVHKNK
ncbi:MAG: mechanosensitive ion channel family protein [Candidatus Omnitrophica bacterium]|nr:mechanosensitive ion channel family protein [Candidatus Omnitrophota bacterium]